MLFSVVVDAVGGCRTVYGLDKPSEMYVEDARTIVRHTALDNLANIPQMKEGLQSKIQNIGAARMPHTSPSLRLCESNSEYDERVFERTRPNDAVLPYIDTCRFGLSILPHNAGMWSPRYATDC
jgi:hypothetical protein